MTNRTTLAFGDDGFDRRRLKQALGITAALITLGVATGTLPKKAEVVATTVGFLAIVL